jgi:hypothetical protein
MNQKTYESKKEKFAAGHRYFLPFAQTHRSIVSFLCNGN